MLDIGKIADLIKTIIEKVFPPADERLKRRKERAKENWDKLVAQEKKIQADLYKRNNTTK